MSLSRDELNRLAADSVDPAGWSVDELTHVRSHRENADLTDEELVQRINERNGIEPTYKLRLEYERRLNLRDYNDDDDDDDDDDD